MNAPTPLTAAPALVAPPAIDVRDLYVSFHVRGRDLEVLRGVSLSIAAGEAYGLVGESGCGKTTLAMALMRYLGKNGSVTGGTMAVDGQDVISMDERSLRELRGTKLAMVYQDPASALNPSKQIGEQIAEVYRFHDGLPRREALLRAEESLRRVAMPHPAAMLRRYPFELSGGQQQRVVIAMALAGNPSVLVLDEPTTGLDATVEAEVLDLIEELRDQIEASILLITHNLGLVARLCDRVGVLYAGRIVEDGPARDVFTEPRHPYTMGLLGCVPRFGARKGETSLVPIPGTIPALGVAMPGCVFEGRCSLRELRCSQSEPELLPWVGDAGGMRTVDETTTRRSRCHFPERVPDMGRAAARPRSSKAAPREGTEILRVSHLRKEFKQGRHRVVAVDDVSIEIRAGETLGLVGESGSGKSTLANCITGLHASDSGVMEFAGCELEPTASRRPEVVRRGIQMVFQNPDATLNPSWTIRGVLGRSVKRLARLSGPARKARVDELARLVHLGPRFLAGKAPELSGGQKQRVAIARAIAGNPELIVCDEPASALDVSVQANILNLLDDLQMRTGVAYILISHDLAVVRYLSDRIAVMYLSRLVEIGDAEDVFTPPHHPYTETLQSAIPTLDFDNPGRRMAFGDASSAGRGEALAGCCFGVRCPRAVADLCAVEQAPWRDAGSGHLIRCHLPLDELRQVQEARLAAR